MATATSTAFPALPRALFRVEYTLIGGATDCDVNAYTEADLSELWSWYEAAVLVMNNTHGPEFATYAPALSPTWECPFGGATNDASRPPRPATNMVFRMPVNDVERSHAALSYGFKTACALRCGVRRDLDQMTANFDPYADQRRVISGNTAAKSCVDLCRALAAQHGGDASEPDKLWGDV